jgi:hypothetical protein
MGIQLADFVPFAVCHRRQAANDSRWSTVIGKGRLALMGKVQDLVHKFRRQHGIFGAKDNAFELSKVGIACFGHANGRVLFDIGIVF